jgi:hypothetical protein
MRALGVEEISLADVRRVQVAPPPHPPTPPRSPAPALPSKAAAAVGR